MSLSQCCPNGKFITNNSCFSEDPDKEEGGTCEPEDQGGLNINNNKEEEQDKFEDGKMTPKKKIPSVEPAARTPGKPSPKKSPVLASFED